MKKFLKISVLSILGIYLSSCARDVVGLSPMYLERWEFTDVEEVGSLVMQKNYSVSLEGGLAKSSVSCELWDMSNGEVFVGFGKASTQVEIDVVDEDTFLINRSVKDIYQFRDQPEDSPQCSVEWNIGRYRLNISNEMLVMEFKARSQEPWSLFVEAQKNATVEEPDEVETVDRSLFPEGSEDLTPKKAKEEKPKPKGEEVPLSKPGNPYIPGAKTIEIY